RQRVDELLEALAILGDVDRIRRGPDDRRTGGLERTAQFERRLPAVLHDHALRLFLVDDLQHILERERLEVQAIRRIVVGRDRFRIAIHHDRLEARFAQRQRRMHAAVVELDPLTDSIGAAAEDHDLLAVRRVRFAFLFIRGIQIRRGGRELGGTRIDALVHGTNAHRRTPATYARLVYAEQGREATIGESFALQRAHSIAIEARQAVRLQLLLLEHEILNLD